MASSTPFTSVLLSDQSLRDPLMVARLCGGPVPEEGVGLRVEGWEPAAGNGTQPDSKPTVESSDGLSVGMIVLIVAGVFIGLAAIYFLRRHYQKTGCSNPLSSSHSVQLSTIGLSTEEGQAHHNALNSALLGDTTSRPSSES